MKTIAIFLGILSLFSSQVVAAVYGGAGYRGRSKSPSRPVSSAGPTACARWKDVREYLAEMRSKDRPAVLIVGCYPHGSAEIKSGASRHGIHIHEDHYTTDINFDSRTMCPDYKLDISTADLPRDMFGQFDEVVAELLLPEEIIKPHAILNLLALAKKGGKIEILFATAASVHGYSPSKKYAYSQFPFPEDNRRAVDALKGVLINRWDTMSMAMGGTSVMGGTELVDTAFRSANYLGHMLAEHGASNIQVFYGRDPISQRDYAGYVTAIKERPAAHDAQFLALQDFKGAASKTVGSKEEELRHFLAELLFNPAYINAHRKEIIDSHDYTVLGFAYPELRKEAVRPYDKAYEEAGAAGETISFKTDGAHKASIDKVRNSFLDKVISKLPPYAGYETLDERQATLIDKTFKHWMIKRRLAE